jgi:fermentation-respiration switch protein FrsA (DUF1100 family)
MNNPKMKKVIVVTGVFLTLAVIAFFAIRGYKNRNTNEASTYYAEEVSFLNSQDNVTLSGTLTLPSLDGNFPVAILISGSGPQDRDGQVFGHKPFFVIAEHLAKNGIAVLRYDDRGFGKSTGNFPTATSLDFSTDVKSAVAYLKTRKEVDANKIGLIGHSDGAMVAPMVAAGSSDVAFVVLLAGPGIKGDKLLVNRQEIVERAMGLPEHEIQKSKNRSEQVFEIIAQSKDPQAARTKLTEYGKEHIDDMPEDAIPPGMTKEKFLFKEIESLTSPWFLYFLSYDPAPTLEKVACPVLALNGDKDIQCPSRENLAAIEAALKKGGNDKVTIKELPNVNHFFQECETGYPDEYARIEQSFSPSVLTEISEWIMVQSN